MNEYLLSQVEKKILTPLVRTIQPRVQSTIQSTPNFLCRSYSCEKRNSEWKGYNGWKGKACKKKFVLHPYLIFTDRKHKEKWIKNILPFELISDEKRSIEHAKIDLSTKFCKCMFDPSCSALVFCVDGSLGKNMMEETKKKTKRKQKTNRKTKVYFWRNLF